MDNPEVTGSNFQALVRSTPLRGDLQFSDRLGPEAMHLIAAADHLRGIGGASAPAPFICTIPFDQLSIFARSYESSAPLVHMPVYAIAEIGLLPGLHPAGDAPAHPGAPEPRVQYPLGLIGTNHIGYASFDLTVLRRLETIQAFQRIQHQLGQTPAPPAAPQTIGLRHLWVFPFGDPILGVDALEAGDPGPQVIALRIELDEVRLTGRVMDRPMVAMQNPNILDWRLSPGSFTLAGTVLVGEDGCETLLPANLATQQVRFRQVVGLTGTSQTAALRNRGGRNIRQQIPPELRAGFLFEYTTEWFSVGHSLGQLLYSLPLAPGEIVKLAVVDWARSDTAGRTEDTGFSESLVHDTLRDRTLTESVRAVLDEWQHGGSMMTGAAGSGSIGVGGLSAALGGAYTTSSGTRDLTGQTSQHIADAFHQASTAIRELRSTVVVQSAQAEQANVQTRVVANYNHSHALTLLYYEVLRHYRVVTRLAALRPAILVENTLQALTFDQAHLADIIARRKILESVLLDDRLQGCFDALERYYTLLNEPAASDPPNPLLDTKFVLFQLRFLTTTYTSNCEVTGSLRNAANDPTSSRQLLAADGQSAILADPNRFDAENFLVQGQAMPAGGSVTWEDAGYLVLHFKPGGDPSHTGLASIDVSGIDDAGVEHPTLGHVGGSLFEADTPEANRYLLIPIARPPKAPALPDPKMRLTEAERTCVDRLLAHLEHNATYYNRAIILNEDANERAVRLESYFLAGIPLLNLIENRALEVLGPFVAFPVNLGMEGMIADQFNIPPDSAPTLDDSFVEQLLALPTRGVFAEAKLGECNASEVVDDTRFWDWQKSPIPFGPPGISDVSTASRAQAPAGLTPTPFPQSVVNIVTPSALPDPTGLANAMKVLSTPNIFRDMSGSQEVATLLGKLSDNATVLGSAVLKDQQQKDLLGTIRNADELSPAQKKDLIGQLLSGQVQQATPSKPAAGSTGSGSGGASGGTVGAGTAGSNIGVGSTGTGAGAAVGDIGGTAAGSEAGSPSASAPPPTPAPKSTKPALPDPVAPKGLTFKISFQNVEGTIVAGTADATIKATTGMMQTFSARPINLGSLTLNTPAITDEGTIGIFAHYQVNSFDAFLGDRIGKAGTPFPTKSLVAEVDGSHGYKLPAQGTIIRLTATPVVEPVKVTASSQQQAVDQVSAGLTANATILSVTGNISTGTTTGTGTTTEYTVNVLTGGLKIEQDL